MSSSELTRQAEFHDWLAERTNRSLSQNQLKKLLLVKQEIDRFWGDNALSFLDVGCGIGKISRWFAECYPKAQTYGIDISPGMLKHAAVNTAGQTIFSMSTAEDMCFPSQQFDVVFEVNTLHHIPDRYAAVAEMARVTKKRGMVISIETNALNPIEVYRACKNFSIEWRTLYNLKWRQNSIFRTVGLQNVRTLNSTYFPDWLSNGEFGYLEETLRTTPLVRELSGVIITIGYKL